MTREEYIELANALKNNYTIDFDKLPELCDMAISALSAEPCEDCISRKEVINAIDERERVDGNVNAEDIRTDICLLPSVQPVIPNMTITINDSYMRNVRRDCGLYE